MNIDIKQIPEGEESIVIRYREMTPLIRKVLGALEGTGGKIWGKADGETLSVSKEEILYLESVDDKVFAYTKDRVLRIEGSLQSFQDQIRDEAFFRCSKSMVINVNKLKSLRSLPSNRIDATMEGGEHILISRRYAVEFRRLLKGER